MNQRLTDLPQTCPEALAQSPAAAGPACRPSKMVHKTVKGSKIVYVTSTVTD